MNKTLTHFFIIIISLILVINVYSQSIYDTYSGFTTPVIPVLPSIEKHPQLFFDSTQITEIRNRATINSYYSNLWNKIITNINYYKTKTASSQNVNNRPRMAKYCAFGWIMNNDTVSLNKAKEALLIAYDNVPRTTTAADFSDIYDEIYRATWLQNYCVAYDWVQKWLSATEDSIIRSKITTEVRILRNHMVDSTRYAPRPHNHRSKPAYAIGTAALTFSSDSRASDWLQFALTQLNTVTKYQFSYDGIYREGGHYHLYSMVNGIPFLWHYKNVSGVDLFPYYKPAFEWPVKVRMGQGWIPHFEDSYLKPFPGHLVARAYTNSPTDLHSTASLGSILQWSYFNTNIFNVNYTGATNDVCWDIDEYLLYDHTIVNVMPSVNPVINMGGGQTIFRKSWNYNDRSNRYLVFHGVAEADNHNHPDQLSFIIEAENSLMATAPGYGKNGYSDPRRNTWYITPEANNLITVDGAPPRDPGVNITPISKYYLNSDFYAQIEKQASYNNGAVWKRAITFPHRNYWIVNDLVRSQQFRTSRYYLHSRGSLSIEGNNARWNLPADQYGQQAIFDAYIISSSNSTMQSQNGWVSLFKDELTAPYIILSNYDTVSMFLSLLFPRAILSQPPIVSFYNNSGILCVKVSNGDTVDWHLLNKDNNTRQVANITTDANYLWISRTNNNFSNLSLTNSKIVQYQNDTLFSSIHPVTLALQYHDKKVTGVVDTILFSTLIKLKLPFKASSLSEFKMNNTSVDYTIVSDSVITFIIESGYLPVSLLSFNGKFINSNTVKLDWVTLSEYNNYGFYVQKYCPAIDSFVTILSSFQPGETNSIQPKFYSWSDENVQDSIVTYRLLQIDIKGLYYYFGPITIHKTTLDTQEILIPREFKLYQNYPNPFNGETLIKFSVAEEGLTNLFLYNTAGKKILTLFSGYCLTNKIYQVTLNSQSLASGVYFYILQNKNEKQVKKLTIIK